MLLRYVCWVDNEETKIIVHFVGPVSLLLRTAAHMVLTGCFLVLSWCSLTRSDFLAPMRRSMSDHAGICTSITNISRFHHLHLDTSHKSLQQVRPLSQTTSQTHCYSFPHVPHLTSTFFPPRTPSSSFSILPRPLCHPRAP